jgi:hypothetical protein
MLNWVYRVVGWIYFHIIPYERNRQLGIWSLHYLEKGFKRNSFQKVSVHTCCVVLISAVYIPIFWHQIVQEVICTPRLRAQNIPDIWKPTYTCTGKNVCRCIQRHTYRSTLWVWFVNKNHWFISVINHFR